ncbi:MAG: hypothetical protein NTX50_30525 [Candidatus Sumerlaeota bacterium]|nr:hypothetical protein [Candidatus Sumerlaeota bacterium]
MFVKIQSGFVLIAALSLAPMIVLAQTGSAKSDSQTEPIAKGQHVFSCGHSFHFGIPPVLEAMAKAAGYSEHQATSPSLIGGSKSIKHWNDKARQTMRDGKVDVVALTPIYLPDNGIEKFAQGILETNPNGRVTVQEFWLPFDQYEPHFYDPPMKPRPAKVDHNTATIEFLRKQHEPYFKEMDEQIRAINQKLGKQVVFAVPVGQAVLTLREKIIAGEAPGLKSQEDLFTDTLGHPKPPLQALLAYCHFAVIYRRSPAGLPLPDILARAKNPKWDDKTNRLLQELAWDAVTHHPLSGVKGKAK